MNKFEIGDWVVFCFIVIVSFGLGGITAYSTLTEEVVKQVVQRYPFTQEALETYPAEKVVFRNVPKNGVEIINGVEVTKPAEKNKYYCDPNFEIDCHGSGVNFKSTEKPLEYPLESENWTIKNDSMEIEIIHHKDGRVGLMDYMSFVGGNSGEQQLKELYQLLKSKYE